MDAATPQTPRVVAIPSDRAWFDPRLINLATQIRTTDYAGAGPFPAIVLPADTRRMMVGFFPNQASNLFEVSPWPDVDQFPLIQVQTPPTIFMLSIFDWGPLISNSWYGMGSGVGSTRIIEILRV